MRKRSQASTKSSRRTTTLRQGRRTKSARRSSRSATPTRPSRTRARSSRTQAGHRTSASSAKTRDHDEIRKWAEARGGQPSIVKSTSRGRNKEGILRIDFPGYSGERSLEHVSWDEWFGTFDDRGLEFLYQEKTANGKQSRFNKLVCP